MKISKRVLSIPPHLITPWENISSVQLEGECIVVALLDGQRIALPGLDNQAIAQIFAAYEKHLENESDLLEPSTSVQQGASFPFPGLPQTGSSAFRLGIGGLEEMSSFMQHDSNQMSAPDMPKEILEKIAGVARVVAPDDVESIPKAEPHCNCPHCQISRAIRQEERQEEKTEEIVTDAELTFRDWDVKEVSKQLYKVTNPINDSEEYTVCLGDQVGCTCGDSNCEHLRQVLMS